VWRHNGKEEALLQSVPRLWILAGCFSIESNTYDAARLIKLSIRFVEPTVVCDRISAKAAMILKAVPFIARLMCVADDFALPLSWKSGDAMLCDEGRTWAAR